jgi:hypothetical protein
MNEEPKSIWKKSWCVPHWLRAWLLVTTVTFFVVVIISQFLPGGPRNASDWMIALAVFLAASMVIATFFLGVWAFVRWLFCRRNHKRALFGLACLATLIALFYAEENWRGWRTWETFRQEWEAKGERFDLASVVPPAVPDDQNFALTAVVAGSYASMLDKTGHEIRPHNTNVVNRLEFELGDISWQSNGLGQWSKSMVSDLKPWQEFYRKLAETTNLFPVTPRPQTSAQDVLLALSKYDATIEEVRVAGKLPDSRFPLEYDKDDPAVILLPHLAALKNAAKLVQLRAIAELQNGESQKALDDVRLTLRLAEAIRTEPFLISHLVRIAILQIAVQPVYEGLAEHRWSDAQLAELDRLLAPENFLADYRTAMRGEMVLLQIGCIQWLKRHPEQISNLGGGGNYDSAPPMPGQIVAWLIPSGWFYQNQYRCVRMTLEYFLPPVDVERETVSPALVRQSDQELSAETKQTSPYNVLEKMLVPALGNAVKKFAYAQASVNLARTAIALERYRLSRGNYPESLALLAPQFIAQLPHDVINGELLKYRREADGRFVLYSIGWNETDDDGVVVFRKGSSAEVDVSQGDWVWRYPRK